MIAHTHTSILAPCDATSFRCLRGDCIASTLVCNAVSNCPSDNSDENGCVTSMLGYISHVVHFNFRSSSTYYFRQWTVGYQSLEISLLFLTENI